VHIQPHFRNVSRFSSAPGQVNPSPTLLPRSTARYGPSARGMDTGQYDRPLPSAVEHIEEQSVVQCLISVRLSSKQQTLYTQVTIIYW
jgi:hypothetical protein